MNKSYFKIYFKGRRKSLLVAYSHRITFTSIISAARRHARASAHVGQCRNMFFLLFEGTLSGIRSALSQLSLLCIIQLATSRTIAIIESVEQFTLLSQPLTNKEAEQKHARCLSDVTVLLVILRTIVDFIFYPCESD